MSWILKSFLSSQLMFCKILSCSKNYLYYHIVVFYLSFNFQMNINVNWEDFITLPS
jgi:hypothetical protein